MKLDLLIAMAEDKSYIAKTSDSTTRTLVEYYEKHGTANERMEAYHYHGAAYRDLHDTPKSLKYFQKALEVADTADVNFNWYQYVILLEQLAAIYYMQDDNQQAIICAKEILKAGDKYDSNKIIDLNILARYYNCADSIQQALVYAGRAMEAIKEEGVNPRNISPLGEILAFYVQRNQQAQADECFRLIKSYNPEELRPNVKAAIGNYLMAKGRYAESLAYHQAADKVFTDIFQKQSSKHSLYGIAKKLGDKEKMLLYAQEFIACSDTAVDIAKLEQTRQVNNAYQYYKDALHEQILEKESEKHKNYFLMTLTTLLLIVIGGYILHHLIIKRRDSKIAMQNVTIESQQMAIGQKDVTIEQLEKQKQNIEGQLKQIEKELCDRKMQALNLSEVQSLFLNPDGSSKTVENDAVWNELFTAVHAAFPNFIAALSERCPQLSLFDKKMICLMKIGMKNAQIADILNRSRGAISQHCAKLKAVYDFDIRDFISES